MFNMKKIIACDAREINKYIKNGKKRMENEMIRKVD
jgi:hypothetical protein